VEGRKILDNIIQAHEIIHTLKSRKKDGMIIQLDFAKAYDKLSWHYMTKRMEAYSFDNHLIQWVMTLVSTTSFSILVNGSPSKPFYPSRDLRQGDPLSPFLFIFMMEGLSRTIKDATEEGTIKGLQLYEYCPTTTVSTRSHLWIVGRGKPDTHQSFMSQVGYKRVKWAQSHESIVLTQKTGLVCTDR
jgi:hypothetical protein